MVKAVRIGSGMGTMRSSAPGPEGVVRRLRKPGDVIDLIRKEKVEGIIALVRAGTVAFAAPLLVSGIPAVITLEGSPETHMGIVAREVGTPCVMSYTPEDESLRAIRDSDYEKYLEEVSRSLEGTKVRLDLTGDEKEGFVEAYVYHIE